MTAVIENWADLIGTVVGVEESTFEGMTTVELELEEVVSVPGYDNLFLEWVGEAVAVEVPSDVAADQEIQEGNRIAVRARLHPHNQRAFAAPDQVGPAPKGMGGAILSDDVPPGGPPPEPPEGPKGPYAAS